LLGPIALQQQQAAGLEGLADAGEDGLALLRRQRLGRDILTPQGNVVSEELEALEGLERPAPDPAHPSWGAPGRPERELT
jgi:hypothetical protein